MGYLNLLKRHFILVNDAFINTTHLSSRLRKIIIKDKKTAGKIIKNSGFRIFILPKIRISQPVVMPLS